jgi:hypothetical protein
VLLRIAEARGDALAAAPHRERLREILAFSEANLPEDEREAFRTRVLPQRTLPR